jgi:hypothetical protein
VANYSFDPCSYNFWYNGIFNCRNLFNGLQRLIPSSIYHAIVDGPIMGGMVFSIQVVERNLYGSLSSMDRMVIFDVYDLGSQLWNIEMVAGLTR